MSSLKDKEFSKLVEEAKRTGIEGWDFSYIKDRMVSKQLPWNYAKIIHPYVQDAENLLDMGTGGGEFLSSISPLPKTTYATESYPPNIPIAKMNLEKLGVEVVAVENHEALPLPNDFFDLIINRHEFYDPNEVQRILKPNGLFITQQVGKLDNIELNQFLGDQAYLTFDWDLEYAVTQLKNHGFEIVGRKEAIIDNSFRDIGAIVFYLQVISWQIPGFDLDANIERLRDLYMHIKAEGEFKTHEHRFLIIARHQ